jgi:Ca-activated chloride channel family protein
VTQGELVAAIGAKARADGISISTVGLGLDYDETLMQLLAQRGGGKYYYVKDSEDLPAVFRQELGFAAAPATHNISVILLPSGAVRNLKIYGYSTQEEGAGQRIEMADFSSGEKRQIMLRVTLTPETGVHVQNVGELKVTYMDALTAEKRNLSLPVNLAVEADKTTRDALNAKARESINAVREESLLLEAEEAHVAAMVALNKGQKEEAKKLLSAGKAQLASAAPSPSVINKRAALDKDDANLEAASRNAEMLQDMSKSAKSSAYQSAQGSKQGIMLQKGDKGFLVEKLQKALTAKGFYKGKIHGSYDAEVEEAVKAFQKSRSLEVNGIAGQATQSALGR